MISIIQTDGAGIAEPKANPLPDLNGRAETITYFIVAVLGFSFWFFMVVPFASHRESYSWLAWVHTQTFAQQFEFGLSSTYRPLAQVVTRVGFVFLNPRIFPTSVPRQALVQGLIYAMFVLAWWLIYSAAPQKRMFALIAFVVGGVFFSGYVHLFHIYGMFYVPVILMLGALIRSDALDTFGKREAWFALTAVILAFWHPFATGLFVGFYFGYYLSTFWRRSLAQHIQAIAILLAGTTFIAALVVIFPRAHMPLATKLFGFLVSYKTNEVNRAASLVAFLLALMVFLSTRLSPRLKLVACLLASALGVVFFLRSLPLLFIWFLAVLVKLFRLRRWSLFFLMLTAAVLPLGGGIGTPVYALFGIIVSVYATSLDWVQAEKAVSFVKTQYVIGAIAALAMVVIMVRAGINVPVVTKVANPLLAERERTYQLEHILAWLHDSDYCAYDIAFAENAGSPIDDVESAITRRNRPPADIEDVQHFWDSDLRCQNGARLPGHGDVAIMTFGGATLANSVLVHQIGARYAGDAAVWVRPHRKIAEQGPN
jgi:hypothetical protein